jgi:hypothetical protein
MTEAINHPRRFFLGSAAAGIATAEMLLMGGAQAQGASASVPAHPPPTRNRWRPSSRSGRASWTSAITKPGPPTGRL